jgi:hypothetical protein
MIVSITGSRSLSISFSDIEAHLPVGTTSIISGGAGGVDSTAASFARSRGIELSVIRPVYTGSLSNRIAPLARNSAIISEADFCLIFWDGISKGTKDTLNKAVKAGKHGKVVVIGSCVSDSVIRF